MRWCGVGPAAAAGLTGGQAGGVQSAQTLQQHMTGGAAVKRLNAIIAITLGMAGAADPSTYVCDTVHSCPTYL